MNNLAFSDEVYPEGIVTFEENLKVILTSKTYKEFQRIKDDQMSRSSKKEVNNIYKFSFGIGGDYIRHKTEDSGSNKGNESINSMQDPFIFNINQEDFPVNLSESSSEDESDSTKKNTEKFPAITATTQQSRAKSDYKSNNKENVGTKSVSDGSHGISRSHKRKVKVRNLSDSSSEDESDSTKENIKKFPTITANTQQCRAKSQYKGDNKENFGIKSVSDGSRVISRSHKRKLLRKEKVGHLSDSSSEDESDSTIENTKKFPTVTATTQQSRVNSEYKSYNIENVGTKSVSDGSDIISRSNKIKQLLKVKERNLSESSSKDEVDSTKKNTEKFPTVTATTQQSRTKSEYKNFNTEDVGIKSVSDGSHIISRSNKSKLLLKMKERNSPYKKIATMKNNEKFPTITATTQQFRAKSECKSYNIENVGTMCACDESQYLETIKESYYRR